MQFVQYQNEIKKLSVDGEEFHDIAFIAIINVLTNLTSLDVSFCNHLTDRTLLYIIENSQQRYYCLTYMFYPDFLI